VADSGWDTQTYHEHLRSHELSIIQTQSPRAARGIIGDQLPLLELITDSVPLKRSFMVGLHRQQDNPGVESFAKRYPFRLDTRF
jgi:hypothetical protein